MLKKAEKHSLLLLTVLFCTVLLCAFFIRQIPGSLSSLSNASPGMQAGYLSDGKMNINEADADLIANLAGIGPAISQRIVEYRNSHGYFQSIDELTNVKGIGPKLLKSIEKYITIGD